VFHDFYPLHSSAFSSHSFPQIQLRGWDSG